MWPTRRTKNNTMGRYEVTKVAVSQLPARKTLNPFVMRMSQVKICAAKTSASITGSRTLQTFPRNLEARHSQIRRSIDKAGGELDMGSPLYDPSLGLSLPCRSGSK